MSTINKVLERVDKLRPNALDAEVKAGWLLDLEGQLWGEVILRHEGADEEGRVRFYPEDGDGELIAGEPYGQVYDYYLMSRIDHYHGEDAAYQQSAALFNDALSQWRARYNREHMPLPSPPMRVF